MRLPLRPLVIGFLLFSGLLFLALLLSARADEPTAVEKEKFQKIMAALSQEDRKKIEDSLASMSPSDRDQFVHRFALNADTVVTGERRKQPTRILGDLRLLDSAIDQYAIETNKNSGMNPTFADLQQYLKRGTSLYNTGADPLGHPYGPFTVDSIPLVSPSTFNTLSDIADAAFWSPFK